MHVAATLPPLATLAPTLRYLDPLSRAVQHVDVHLGERLGAEMLAQCATESAQHCSGFFAPTSAPPWRPT